MSSRDSCRESSGKTTGNAAQHFLEPQHPLLGSPHNKELFHTVNLTHLLDFFLSFCL